MIDVSYHGVVQVIYARGQQGFLAKYSWIEFTFNIGATFVFVRFFGPVGSAWALAATILVTDVIGFPIIMRGRWTAHAGRFVMSHGVLQSIAAAVATIFLGTGPVLITHGLPIHVGILAVLGLLMFVVTFLTIGPSRREEARSLLRVQ
jgi:O-antigen/teichoic acid export membrane protein